MQQCTSASWLLMYPDPHLKGPRKLLMPSGYERGADVVDSLVQPRRSTSYTEW